MAEKTEEIDRGRLLALFDLAGPDQAEELAVRLQDDLSTVSQALEAALSGADRQVLCSQSHVLMGISGTVGAEGLQGLAGQLNRLAHAPGSANFTGLIAEIQHRLARLITEVRETRALWAEQT